jgi:predicted nicotinamide N-methyase
MPTIHGVDQRSPTVRVEHSALAGGLVEVEQCPAGSANFQPNTSSVIWSCGARLARHLCEHPELVAGRRCVELGSGIGLVGAAAAAVGAASVLLTDVAEAVPLLERNAARVNAGLAEPRLRAQDLLWGEDEAIARAGAGAFDVVLGADVLYFQDAADVSKLVRTLERLLAPGGTVVLAYEWREDWETTGAFHDACKAAGLLDEMVDLHETDREDAVLFLLRRGAAAAECGPV